MSAEEAPYDDIWSQDLCPPLTNKQNIQNCKGGEKINLELFSINLYLMENNPSLNQTYFFARKNRVHVKKALLIAGEFYLTICTELDKLNLVCVVPPRINTDKTSSMVRIICVPSKTENTPDYVADFPIPIRRSTSNVIFLAQNSQSYKFIALPEGSKLIHAFYRGSDRKREVTISHTDQTVELSDFDRVNLKVLCPSNQGITLVKIHFHFIDQMELAE